MKYRIIIFMNLCVVSFTLPIFIYPQAGRINKPLPASRPTVIEETPVEDLSKEHGLINRLFIIYEELVRRLKTTRSCPVAVLANTAQIFRTFVQDYHEKNEETYVFPYFEKAGLQVDLIKTLKNQHQRGRQLTDTIYMMANEQTINNKRKRKKLIKTIEQMITMYRAHESREDTIIFPQLRSLIDKTTYEKLGDIFEEKETQLFGANGFESILNKVVDIEKSLEICELDHFTP